MTRTRFDGRIAARLGGAPERALSHGDCLYRCQSCGMEWTRKDTTERPGYHGYAEVRQCKRCAPPRGYCLPILQTDTEDEGAYDP